MKRSQMVALAAALALLGAGIGAAVSHGSTPARPAARTAPSTTVTSVTPSTTASASPPGSGPLQAGLITPTDMGGYYHVEAGAASALFGSSVCLGPLQASPSQAARAETALLGPDLHSIPTIMEVVTSYPGGVAAAYSDVTAALGNCHTLSFVFAGSRVEARLSAAPVAPVGDSDAAWAGDFSYSGDTLRIELGVALDGHTVVALAFVDSVPPADPVMGDFPSTLSLAIGKLA